jgi:hypothetical protein
MQLDFGVQHDMIGMSGELIWFIIFKIFIFHAKEPLSYLSASLQLYKYPIQACFAWTAGDTAHNVVHHHLPYFYILQLLFQILG